MIRHSSKAVYVIFLVLLVECLIAGGSDTPGMPDDEHKMRLVSFPCDITLDDLRAAENNRQLVVYQWNGSDYEQATTLERGRGYFVSISTAVSPGSNVCSGRDAKGPVEIQLKQGWNLIGLPVNRAMKVRDALGAVADAPATRVFTLRGSTFSLLTAADRLEPRKGYWVYTDRDASVSADTFAKELKISSNDLINVGTPDVCSGIWPETFHDNVVSVGKIVTLNAEIIEMGSGKAASNVAWSVDKPDVATIDGNGKLTTKAAGTVEVKAAVAGAPGAMLQVNVINTAVPVCLSLGPAKGAQIFGGATVNLSLNALFFVPEKPCAANTPNCRFRADDVFNQASFTMSVPETGTISNNLFTASKKLGKTTIEAEYKGLKSNPITIEVTNGILREFEISVDPNAVSTPCRLNNNTVYAMVGKKLGFSAAGNYSNQQGEERKNVSAQALWTVSDLDIASVENGILIGKAPGVVQVQAMFEDRQSKTFDVHVVKENAPVCLNLSLVDNSTGRLYTGEKAVFKVEEVTITSTVYGSVFKSRVATPEAALSHTQSAIGAFSGAVFTAGQTDGETIVTAAKGSMTSNSIKLSITNYKWTRVTISNYTNFYTPYGCGGGKSLPQLAVGAEMPLRADGYYDDRGYYGNSMKEVTSSAVWTVSDAGIAEIRGGVVRGLKSGTVTITAAMGGVASPPYTLNVRNADDVLCMALSAPSGLSSIEPGKTLQLKATAYLFPTNELCKTPSGAYITASTALCQIDVTKNVSRWNLTDAKTGSVDENGVFKAAIYEKFTDVTATFRGITSNSVTIAIQSKIWSSLSLGLTTRPVSHSPCGGVNAFLISPGEKLNFKATGYYKESNSSRSYYSYNSSYMDVTTQVVWNLSDESIAEIKNGEITGKSEGTVTLSASIGGATSERYYIQVRNKEEMLCLSLKAPSDIVEPAGDLQLKATAYFFSTNNLCQTQYAGNAGICQADVTKSVSLWTMSQPDAGAINANGNFHASDKEATTDVTATYLDDDSNKFTVKVRNKKWTNIFVSYVSGVYTKKPYSCGTSSSEPMIAPGDKLTFKAVGYYAYSVSNGIYSSGSSTDITEQGTWKVSDESVGEIKGGVFTGKRAGMVTITASYGGISGEYRITVFEKEKPLCVVLSPSSGLKIPPGGAARLAASAYFLPASSKCQTNVQSSNSGNYCYADVTKDVSSWELTQPPAGAIDSAGTFKAGGKEISTQVAAVYEGLKSNSITVNVKKVNWMLLWASTNAPVLPQCPLSGHYSGCYAAKPGETYQLSAKAQEDSYMWTNPQDVTAMAKWEVSDPAVAEISSGGALKAKKQGLVWIRAYVGDARSDKIWLAVGEKSGFEFVLLGTTGDYGGYKPIKPLQVGSSYPVTAIYYKFSPSSGNSYCSNYYDDGWGYDDYSGSYTCSKDYVASDITSSADWKVSNDALGQVTTSSSNYYYYNSSARYFKGLAPGMADVIAEYKGLKSNALTIDVWNLQSMTYCDANNVNMGEWKDNVSAATLETDCKVYNKGENVRIRYSAYVDNKIYLDNCLDLFILDDKNNIVRTLRNEGCTSESLDHSTMGRRSPDYQTIAAWDMKNDSGKAVPAGQYYAVARFYIVWEPVIRLPFTIR